MNMLDGPYFRVNKFLAKVCGIWPYQSRVINMYHFTFFVVTVFSFLFALIAGLMHESSWDLILVLETFVVLVFVFGGTVDCIILYVHQSKIKLLYERILKDWKKISDKHERAILVDHTRSGQKHLVPALTYLVVSTVISCLSGLVKSSSTTDDYLRALPYYCHCMIVDATYYHYQVLAHHSLAIVLVTIAYMAFSRSFITNVRHVCGLYGIARYRLENVVEKKSSDSAIHDELVVNFISTIRQHGQAISDLKIIEKVFSLPLLVTEFMGLACMAILIFDIKYHLNNTLELIRLMFMLSQFIVYLLYLNATGELVLKSCDDLSKAAYYIKWYEMPLKIRKLLLVIMIRTGRRNHLTAASLVILSLETYAMVLKTSWSFATVLFTVLNKHKGSQKE